MWLPVLYRIPFGGSEHLSQGALCCGLGGLLATAKPRRKINRPPANLINKVRNHCEMTSASVLALIKKVNLSVYIHSALGRPSAPDDALRCSKILGLRF
jgi:hypothetical protein